MFLCLALINSNIYLCNAHTHDLTLSDPDRNLCCSNITILERIKDLSFDCKPDRRQRIYNKPNHYTSHNHLLKIRDGSTNKHADQIVIRGLIVDENCVPVPDARIELWQKDEYGDTRITVKKHIMHRDMQTTGIAHSNNNGNFYFITVSPSRYSGIKTDRNIGVTISHADFKIFERKVFLESVNDDTVPGLGTIEIYDMKVVLDGTNRHRKY